ncbi:MAG: N-(5'-phosphoribosyl)anthranilate isomerase [Cyclobacteriaceae bacterium]|nr:N-(5'-phosphoribosyl)anthranilate isomerase [Cyclobacteriaceae bacterium]MBX2957179.1 N-(5'-phosphoribosyl)anthranilate isomerase [Cyclobacteriaceae bacterium]
MGLKTTVKVGSITNLSDARYCAGMGVDILGFNAVEGKPDYISPIQFEELRGWFVGPKVVIEIYGIDRVEAFETLLNNYQPDMIELSCHELLKLRPHEIPLILSIHPDQYLDQKAVLRDFKSSIQFLQLPATCDKKLLQEIAKQFQVLLEPVDGVEPDINFIKDNPGIGLALKGSVEEKAGYKSYDQLSVILEQLEQD